MTLRLRLVLFAFALVVAVVVAVAGALGWQARRAILLQAEADGSRIAGLLAHSASIATSVPQEIEQVVGQQMVSEALLTAHLLDIAGQAGMSDREIDARLAEIAARSTIGEIWSLDGEGAVRYGSLPGATTGAEYWAFGKEAGFEPLMDGERFAMVGPMIDRGRDGDAFKYAGVRGLDGSGAALVGYPLDFIDGIVERIGLARMVRSLLGSGEVEAVWVFDHRGEPLAQGASGGSESRRGPDARERAAVQAGIRAGKRASWFGPAGLVVVAPVPSAHGGTMGAALLHLSTDGLDALIRSGTFYAIVVGALAILASLVAAAYIAHRITRPLAAIGAAAGAVEARRFSRGQLAATAARRDEFGNLARVFETMAATVDRRQEETEAIVSERTQALSERNAELAAVNAQIGRELDLAKAMQTAILPAAFPEDGRFDGFASMQAARQVGGDFYDHFMLDEHRLAIVMADVSGKGVPAAFFMAVSRTILQSVAKETEGPAACLARANDLICRENPLELFVTVFYGVLDLRTGELRFANGGHNPPYRLAGNAVEALESKGGMALGVMEDMPYAQTSIKLARGEALFLFTDGLTEAFDPLGNAFGERRLETLLAGRADRSARELTQEAGASVQAFADGAPQSDDLTMMTLRFLGAHDSGPEQMDRQSGTA